MEKDFLNEYQEKARLDLEAAAAVSRSEKRQLWEKLITIILAILGFSLSVFSINSLSDKIIQSPSGFLLLFSWILYCLALFLGFILLKEESSLNQEEYSRRVFYSMDLTDILDANLNVKAGKKDKYIALQVLHGKRSKENDFWSSSALEIYEKTKKDLESYNIVKDPEKFYSYVHHSIVNRCEKWFYGIIIVSTVILILSVAILFF